MPMELVPLGDDVFIELIVRNKQGVHKVVRLISEDQLVASYLEPKVFIGLEIQIAAEQMIENLFAPKENEQ